MYRFSRFVIVAFIFCVAPTIALPGPPPPVFPGFDWLALAAISRFPPLLPILPG